MKRARKSNNGKCGITIVILTILTATGKDWITMLLGHKPTAALGSPLKQILSGDQVTVAY